MCVRDACSPGGMCVRHVHAVLEACVCTCVRHTCSPGGMCVYVCKTCACSSGGTRACGCIYVCMCTHALQVLEVLLY